MGQRGRKSFGSRSRARAKLSARGRWIAGATKGFATKCAHAREGSALGLTGSKIAPAPRRVATRRGHRGFFFFFGGGGGGGGGKKKKKKKKKGGGGGGGGGKKKKKFDLAIKEGGTAGQAGHLGTNIPPCPGTDGRHFPIKKLHNAGRIGQGSHSILRRPISRDTASFALSAASRARLNALRWRSPSFFSSSSSDACSAMAA